MAQGVEVPIKLTVSGQQQTEKAVDGLSDSFKELRDSIKSTGNPGADKLLSDMRATGRELDKTQYEASLLRREIESTVKQTARLEENLQASVNQLSRANSEATKLSSSLDARSARGGGNVDIVREQVSSTGDISTGLGSFGSALGGVGLGGAGSALQVGGDFAGALEYIPATVQGIASLGLAAFPLIGVTAGVAAGAVLLNKEFKESEKVIRDLAEEERNRAESLIQTRQDLRNLTADQVRQQVDDLRFAADAQQQALDASIAGFQTQIQNVEGFGDSVTTAASGLGALAGINFGSFGEARKQIETYNEEIENTNEEIERLSQEVLPQLLAQQQLATNRSAGQLQGQQAIDELTEQRDRTLELQNIIATSTSESVRTQIEGYQRQQEAQREYVSGLEQQIADAENLQKELLQGDLTNPEIVRQVDEATAKLTTLRIELVNAQQSLDGTSQSISDLTNTALPAIAANEQLAKAMEQGRKSALALRSDLESTGQQLQDFLANEDAQSARKAQEAALKATRTEEESLLKTRYDGLIAARESAKAQERIKGVEQERIAKITDINIKFFNDSLKRTQEFYLKEKRSQEDANLQRLRMVEDLQADLFEASAANDINSFITRMRQGNRDLTRFDQDTSIDARRRSEDFALSNSDSIAAREREIRQVQETSAQKLAAERDGQVKSLTLEQQYQTELQRLKEGWAKADIQRQDELQRQAAQARYNALITDLQTTQRALMENQRAMAQNAAVAGQNTGAGFINAFVSTVNSAVAANRGGSTAPVIPQLARQGRNTITAFAEGGYVDRPTLALLGERGYPELILPMKQSEGLGAMGRMAPQITVDFRGANLGGISPEVLDSKLNTFANQIVVGIQQGFNG